MSGISLSGITKSYGDTPVLKGVDLEIADGEFLTLVGPSGCGKSTLLRIIAGLEGQDDGRVAIGERNVDSLRASARNLSMVFQSYALYPHLTVAENIAVPLTMRRLSAWQRLPVIGDLMPGARGRRREIGSAVAEAAEMLNIGHLLHRKPGQLSGGQRQRVAVGRALVRDPEAFLLDEPLSNLDAKLRVHMRSEIAQLHRRLSATFVYVTHDQAEAMTMPDRVAVMMEGELLQVAPPAEVYDRPADLRVAEFIGSPTINVLPAERGPGGGLSVLGRSLGLMPRSDAEIASIGVRPEATLIGSGNAVGGEAALLGKVRHVENLGPELFVQVTVDGLEPPLIAKAPTALAPRLVFGGAVAIDFDHGKTLAFDHAGKAVPLVEPALPREAAYG